MIRFFFISVLLFSCSVQKKMNDNVCSNALLKAVQFNGLIENGVKDRSVYEVIDLKAFYKTTDSVVAKRNWESFIDETRFYEGQKTTLHTDYKNYECECEKHRDSVFIYLTHIGISKSTFKLYRNDSVFKIVSFRSSRL